MPHYILNAAWEVPKALGTDRGPLRQAPADCDTSLRPKFALTENNAFVHEVGASSPLPSRRVINNGGAFRITELPGPALDGDKAHKDTFEIRVEDDVVDYIQITYKAPRSFYLFKFRKGLYSLGGLIRPGAGRDGFYYPQHLEGRPIAG